MHVACVNQDPGVSTARKKGAGVHLRAMREAFAACGATVVPLDVDDEAKLATRLAAAPPLDLVYERYAVGRIAASEFARERGIPHVIEVNAPLAEEASRWRGRAVSEEDRTRDAAMFSSATRVLAVSNLVADYARRRGAPAQAVEVVPNAVDARRFHPRAPDDELRARLIPAGRLVLGFHGRLRPWHGFELLARAFAELARRGVAVHLLIVGEGDFDEHLGGIAPSSVTRIEWVPHDEVHRYVACMDVLPLTYDDRTPCYFSPLKLAEAMACGAVPVVPRLGDLPHVVRDGRSGLVYAPGDVEALIDAIARLCDEPDLRRKLAADAVRQATEHSWEDIAGHVLALAREGNRTLRLRG